MKNLISKIIKAYQAWQKYWQDLEEKQKQEDAQAIENGGLPDRMIW